MTDEKPDWMRDAEAAGWSSPDGPGFAVPPPAQEPPPAWMQEAQAAGWNPTDQQPPAPQPEPQWMQDARAAGWNPTHMQPPAPMPMAMAMAPPPGPPQGPGYLPAEQQPPPPQKPDRPGWLVPVSIACVLLVLGIGAAVVIAVSSGGDDPKLVAPATASVAATTPKTTTTVYVKPKAAKKKKKKVVVTSNNTPTSNITPVQNTAADRVAIENVLNRHFQALVDGNYMSSYNDLTGSLASGSSSWVDAQRQDGLYEFSLNVSPSVNGSTASAQIVNFTTKAADSGCHSWSGAWGMTKIGGTWKISQSSLSRGGC